MKKILNIFTLILIFNIGKSFGQDTIRLKGHLRETFLLESFELYPDKTFKWTNEYDLSWSEYGEYKIEKNKLTFDFYIWMWKPTSMSIKDSISKVPKKLSTRIFEIDEKRIYPITEKGKRVIKMKDPYYRRKWSWLFGNKYEYKIMADKKL
ncbi:hypothetical protein [Polaribacter atrinae]|uniref:Uncharacterized protein n=1 Tax=Polaribacter atrinae TaxID=1333662 RepID=A0A176T4N5_9FLAO|nr:hypothetical protein [Polaribacter atrinae]OAD42373.1 hypothetical protein LPB303_14845 [Polaribacter atrinae]